MLMFAVVVILAKGALASVNILNNNIGAEHAQKLVAILKEHATLKSLCGNKGNETELDMRHVVDYSSRVSTPSLCAPIQEARLSRLPDSNHYSGVTCTLTPCGRFKYAGPRRGFDLRAS